MTNNIKIKFCIFFISILFSFYSYSERFTREASGFSSNEEFVLSNGSKVIHYQNNTTWKDSIGNYGYSVCYGIIVINKKKIIIDYNLYCQFYDQDKHNFTQKYFRDTDIEVGLGKSATIDGTGKWLKYINSGCEYAINYVDKALFLNERCKKP